MAEVCGKFPISVETQPSAAAACVKRSLCESPLRLVYTMMKTQRFRVSIGRFISKEKIFRFIKPASLMRKRLDFTIVNEPTLASFCLFVFFTNKILQKKLLNSVDSNLDHMSLRRAH